MEVAVLCSPDIAYVSHRSFAVWAGGLHLSGKEFPVSGFAFFRNRSHAEINGYWGGADINSRNTIRSCWPGLLFCRWWPCLKGSAFCLWGNVPLGNSISAVSLLQYVCFFVALSFKSNQKCWLSVWGEKYSLYIYIFHPVFVYCCKALLKGTILFAGYTYVAPVVVLLLTMLFVRLLLLVRG